MELVGALAACLQIVASLVVGCRLIVVARATRHLPELALGLSQLLGTALGYPLLGAAFFLSKRGDALSGPLLLAGAVVVAGSAWMFFLFTWRVFRRRERWAAALSASGAVVLVSSAAISAIEINRSGGYAIAYADVLLPVLVFNVTTGVAYGWSAIESLTYYTKVRRRVVLGLSDPVVADRFLLWGLTSVMLTIIVGFCLGMLLLRANPIGSVLGALVFACLGLGQMSCLWLAFVPPRAYTRWVSARSGGAAVAA